MAQHEITRRTYLFVFLWLMLLLILTVLVSFIPYHRWGVESLGVTVTLLIAIVKATLVVLYFMHVRHSQVLNKIVIIVAISWFGILIVLTLSDYLTRGWLPLSSGWSEYSEIPPPP